MPIGNRRVQIHGVGLDPQTRCVHYNTSIDIIAIKMKCCLDYYACNDCHDALAGHAASVWPRDEWNSPAVICGACSHEMTVRQYLDCSNTCPRCSAAFNPGCRTHYHLYFEYGEER